LIIDNDRKRAIDNGKCIMTRGGGMGKKGEERRGLAMQRRSGNCDIKPAAPEKVRLRSLLKNNKNRK